MKKLLLIYYFLMAAFSAASQEPASLNEKAAEQLESLAASSDDAIKDDSYLQQLDHFKKHPLNINTASAEELEELNLLSGLQIEELFTYKKLLGKLVNLYEMQAIPSWDMGTIKKILPFVTVADDKNIVENLKDRWKGGEAAFLLRYGRDLEKAKGYDIPATTGTNYYLGSRDQLFFRYTYNYKNLLQWGLLGDKDAGEQFFRGNQRQGFDFYSFHFFARKLGVIKALAIGDFTVNFGQGLIQWQSLAFKKNADVLSVKRQAASIRPYNSAGEYNFHRGVAVTLQKRNWETTLFASLRNISANTVADTAAVTSDAVVSSFLVSGYHRTASENEDRNSLRQTAIGGNLKYQGNNWHAGISTIHYHFSKPVQKSADPYNLFALQGSSLTNTSIDYSYTWRNIHLFGEAATDNKLNKAFVNGAVISMDAKVDASLLYRNISRAYQSVNANAFTENTAPANETGFYAGVCLRPAGTIRIDAYTDIFRFPWLKYRVDAPSAGKDYFIQLSYTPNKRAEIYVRYKNEAKMINRSGSNTSTSLIDLIPQKNLRMQTSYILNQQLALQNRVELLWYNNKNLPAAGQGFLGYIEASYKPAFKHWNGNLRLQYFEADGYNERIYSYETDLPYNFSIPFYYDKGFRYYFNVNWYAPRLNKKNKKNPVAADIWMRWAQTIYADKSSVGSGLDEIKGNRRSEIKLQLMFHW